MVVKYFVAHLLSGDAKAYHAGLTRVLSSKFHIIPLHERIPPHITIKPPFETDEAGIKEVERVIRAFAHHERAIPLVFDGFGRFGFRTIYMDVYKSAEVVSLVRRAVHTLNAHIDWMVAGPLEGNKLHASVARFLNRKQFRRIWRELRMLHPHFESSFDSIAILKKEDRTWSIHSLIPLNSPHEELVHQHVRATFERGSELVTLSQ